MAAMATRRQSGCAGLLGLALVAGCSSREAGSAQTAPAVGPAPSSSTASTLIDFNSMPLGEAPAGFSSARTGAGSPGSWRIGQADDVMIRALAQLSDDRTDGRYPLCVFDAFSAADVKVSCEFKAVGGEVDQAAGLVVRYTDENNYYVVRANALEDNVRLYRVVDGERVQFAGADLPIERDVWHKLSLHLRGTHFDVFWNDELLFSAQDATLSGAGKVGLWTKADSLTWFDDLRFAALRP